MDVQRSLNGASMTAASLGEERDKAIAEKEKALAERKQAYEDLGQAYEDWGAERNYWIKVALFLAVVAVGLYFRGY